MNRLELIIDRQRMVVATEAAIDLSIPLMFEGEQPSFFGAPRASAHTLAAGEFVGNTREGGSCNVSQYTLIPHCNGTHTECIGHVVDDRVALAEIAENALIPATLLTVEPEKRPSPDVTDGPGVQPGDRVITAEVVKQAIARHDHPTFRRALVLRTLPNPEEKAAWHYGEEAVAAYLTPGAVEVLVEREVEHLVLDLPSVDRFDDPELRGHRIFWGLPAGSRTRAEATRPNATITELAYVPTPATDGYYMLSLQVAPFMADAAPSRPVLYPLENA